MGNLQLQARQSPDQSEILIETADALIEQRQYLPAFDTLIYGIGQFDLNLNQSELNQVAQTNAYLKLLDAFTLRLFRYDTYGQYVALKDRIDYLEDVIELADAQNLDSLMTAKTYMLGVTYNLMPNYQESIVNHEKVRALSLAGGHDELHLRSLYQLSKGYRNIGNTEKSLEILIEYEKQSKRHNVSYHLQTATEALGNFYLNQKDYERSIAYYKNSIQQAEEFGLDPHYSLTSLAVSFDDSDSLDQAQATYQKAFDNLKSADADQDYYLKMSGLAINYGTFFNSKKQDYESALAMFQEGLEAAEAIDYQYYIAYAKEGMAESYHEMHEDQKALDIRLGNYELIQKIGEVELTRQAETGLSGSYERLGRYKEALFHFQLGKQLTDSLLNSQKIQAIATLETEYETEKKEQEITILNEKTERQRARQNGLIIIGVLLIIVLIVVFLALKSKQKANRLITLQKDALANSNQQLKELSEFKENLTHMIVHDMKNPLNSVIGLSQGEATEKKLHTIGQSGQQMLNMVSNMLDVQKFKEARVNLNTEAHNFLKLFKEAQTPLELLMHAKNIVLNTEIDTRVSVEVDSELVIRILGNLLSNALKFSELGASIDVKATLNKNEQLLLISITDHGMGLTPDQLKQVFDKYWQGERQAGYSSSTGLGLTFCKLAVEAHGGAITAESDPGKFTTFNFSLPIADVVENVEEAPAPVTLEREESLILESDIAILSKYISELGSLKVHQVGKINQIVRQMDEEEVKSPWKNDLVSAMHQGNQARFDELIAMLK